MPRGMIVTLSTGSVFLTTRPTIACPTHGKRSFFSLFRPSRGCGALFHSGPCRTLLGFVSGDGRSAAAGGEEGGFVENIREISSRGAWGIAGNFHEIDGSIEFDFAGMDFKDLKPAFNIRKIDHDAAVKTAGTQEGLIEDVRAVGRGDENNPFVRDQNRPFQREVGLKFARAHHGRRRCRRRGCGRPHRFHP